MNIEDYFTSIEENTKEEQKTEITETPTFIQSLPDWDLEPPYETIRRDNE